jgi:hypothetical protein
VKWSVNKDQALVLVVDPDVCVGGVWRGAWKDALGQRHDGYIAASWHPYKRIGHFADVKTAKAAVEKAITREST